MPRATVLFRRAPRDAPAAQDDAVAALPAADRAAGWPGWRWAAPLAVTLLAAVLRFWNLAHPATLMFDETYYVKDAWTLLNLGYEGAWPEDYTDADFSAGKVDEFTGAPSYPAHPPLGKWLIAVGLALFGAENPVGWRFSVALAGTLAVLLLTLIATALFRSTALGVLTGALLAIDGLAIVLSRVSLLDTFVMLLALLGFGAVLLDRRERDRRLTQWQESRPPDGATGWGPLLLWRPWLLAAGIAFGLTCAVKWSGIYFLAAFGLYVVVTDALAWRRAGADGWLPATLLRQAPLAFVTMVPAAFAAYLASFTGWLVTSGGYDRNWIAQGGERWTGVLAWVPDVLQNLWHWHAGIYSFHTGLSATHAYATPAILWPLLARPTQVYYVGSAAGENGCAFDYCSEIVWSIANPILWWAAVAATGYLVYRFARYRDWRHGLILMGVAAGYLPWLLYPTRTMFQFYSIAFEPYLLLALTAVIAAVGTGRRGETVSEERAIVARRVIAVFLVVVVLVSAFFYPLWTGVQTPFWFWQMHVWLASWV
ncbi:dolichyl-phosphate-mannose--protein mannosyltransferase [Naasia sp. SYSU D00948]|uniref:dolichyl-phosphate-mannose--protein mannosyltransferase n=1 Tax=Naasia sp. SYSU D00948 TaxID=2817379 RepID=UPI001B311704|nr:phospholipid carrier-dependent glycosyltransferase [Naasia sp. SYSU D00948]